MCSFVPFIPTVEVTCISFPGYETPRYRKSTGRSSRARYAAARSLLTDLRDVTRRIETRRRCADVGSQVDAYWKKYPLRSHRERASPGHEDADEEADADADAFRNRREMEENLLILFRKLREGLLSTHRRDAFALEVYETSLHLSVLFNSPVQTTSTLSHLFPDLYVTVNIRPPPAPSPPPSASASSSSNSAPTADPLAPTLSSQSQDSRPATQASAPLPPAPASQPAPSPSSVPRSALSSTLLLLLHHLAQSYPSQIAFHTQLRQLHPALQDVLRAPLLPPPPPPHPAFPSSSSSPRPSRLPSAVPWLPSAPATEPQQAASSPRSDTSATPSRPSPPPSAGPPVGLGSQRPDPSCSATETRTQTQTLSAEGWVLELARCLRARNYARLDALTRREAYAPFVAQSDHLQCGAHRLGPGSGPAQKGSHAHGESDVINIGNDASVPAGTGSTRMHTHPTNTATEGDGGLGADTDSTDGASLALEALGALVETLLDKARGTTWAVLRSAYREVSLRTAVPVPGAGTTGEWLARSLVLRGGAERWLDGRRARGEARRKEGEGMEGRWVLVKA
ncbi:hypothetical protein K466DRAFT_283725 [Polyporus arcularius HHB13444]|uniref:Uncharacterized protein n=1 Tax=Polyporus arcularius HHB13444 TaxID=1314778 RepID=A0A5C3PU30_9APHY|nr:hypothetical protein K466DRAFT_283725 [Polyporus arcularius HHB13444]